MSNLYVLEKDMPGMAAGAIFEWKEHEKKGDIGSISYGYLSNAWVNGDCQGDTNHKWAARTHILPGQLRDDRDWFTPVKQLGNSSHIFTVNNTRFKRIIK